MSTPDALTPEQIERINTRFPQPDPAARQAALVKSIEGLEQLYPDLVSNRTFVRWQLIALITVPTLTVIAAVIDPRLTAGVVASIIVTTYLIIMAVRLQVFWRGLKAAEASGSGTPVATRGEMPFYTVLMPAYDEPEVITALMRATSEIDYPHDSFEVLLMLEEDDVRTLTVLLEVDLPPEVIVLLVPAAEPRTKPKACNYGLEFARGEYITIYDAEDRPEPLQLRKSVALFEAGPPELACAQGRLHYFNPEQNLLTRWFTIEYTTWFGVFLKGLSVLRLPIPLGGTSNHMRTSVLRQAGGWDAFNVTEDADLGLRLARLGYYTEVLDSVTLEEANSDWVNWIRQRSRWYKGYLQTWLVHFRKPAEAYRIFGFRGTVSITLLIGATPILAVANLFTWLCTLAFIIGVPNSFDTIFPLPVIYAGTACTLLGNAAMIYVSVLAMAEHERGRYGWASLLFPIYWLLMAIAATKACVQLITKPSYWEKTAHGLNETAAEA
jgi:cellulose synthase/poly-beta-1,6-N-acetylglucosamine synthase-like glycosyltransferase